MYSKWCSEVYMLAIRLSDEIESRLDAGEAKPAEQRRFAREAILAHLEDRGLLSSAETAARVRRGDEAVHSSEDVRKSLGLDD